MAFSANAFADFYESETGRLAQQAVSLKIRDYWHDVRHHKVLGLGYALPYLDKSLEQAERVITMIPEARGAQPWPKEGGNLLCSGDARDLPFPVESFDRILAVHYFEFTGRLPKAIEQAWRVLQPNGRLLLVVPNRLSAWARADHTPFGCGTPFTLGQIETVLRQNKFRIERTQRTLFVPPFRSERLSRYLAVFEGGGQVLLPGLCGAFVIEASKQIYAPVKPDRGSKLEAAARILIPKPEPSGT